MDSLNDDCILAIFGKIPIWDLVVRDLYKTIIIQLLLIIIFLQESVSKVCTRFERLCKERELFRLCTLQPERECLNTFTRFTATLDEDFEGIRDTYTFPYASRTKCPCQQCQFMQDIGPIQLRTLIDSNVVFTSYTKVVDLGYR